jgi:uncharacterized protein
MDELPGSPPPPAAEPVLPPPAFGPVKAFERLTSVDVLRGAAVLGILVMNIQAFGNVWPSYSNPLVAGMEGPLDMGTWWVAHLFFDMKFMTIFSMLFGAGLALMAERAEAKGSRFGSFYYRRLFWLLAIGAAHAYLIWYGDILFWYAVCGFFIYPMRRLRPATLLVVGSLLLLVVVPLMLGFGKFVVPKIKSAAVEAIAARDAGEELTEEQTEAIATWDEFHPTEEKIQEEVEVYSGSSWLRQVAFRAPMVIGFQIFGLAIFGWRIVGLMVIGVALMKLGVFAARRSTLFYLLCVVIGYGVGLTIVWLGGRQLVAHQWETLFMKQGGMLPNYFVSLGVAMGHVGVVMLLCKSGALPWLTGRLEAVGRMAFTSYLTHSLVCTTLFYGWGFGLFGTLSRFELMGVVLAIFIAQLVVSPLWLLRFRFGPAEWLWRSLTYGKPQPMRAGAD